MNIPLWITLKLFEKPRTLFIFAMQIKLNKLSLSLGMLKNEYKSIK